MGWRAGKFNNACFRSACASICVGPNSKGMPFQVRLTNAFVCYAKFCMNMWQSPTVPRNAQTSERSLQGPQLTIYFMQVWSGSWPNGVQQCLTAMISSAQRVDLYLMKVPPQYLTHCTTWFKPWKCSQMNWQIPRFLAIHLSVPSARMYRSAGPWIGTLSM